MDPIGLVGRNDELEALGALLALDRPVAVVGEAGIGKTTLVRAAAARSAFRLREGGALETLAWTPFLPLRRAIGDGLSGEVTAVATEVERRVGPDLLFVDDLQWADDDTRDVLELLAGRVALVTAVRTGDPASPSATALVRDIGGEILELAGLGSAASAAIVRRARPAAAAQEVDRLVELAGGNPLLLEELATRGEPTTTLGRAFAKRLDELSPAGHRAFALLAVAGRALPASVLGRGAAELQRTEIVFETNGELAVRHRLFAEAAISRLSNRERSRYHLELAGVLRDPGERSRHLAGSGRTAEAAEAARAAANAAQTATERATHLELVAHLTDGPTADAARIEAARIFVGNSGSGPARAARMLEAIQDGPDELLVERDALMARAYWELGDLAATRAAYRRGRGRPVSRSSLARARLDADEVSFVVNVDRDFATGRRILDEAIAAGRTTPRIMATDAGLRSLRDGVDTLDQAILAYEAACHDPIDRFPAFRNARNVAFIAMEHRGYDLALSFLEGAISRFDAWQMPARADELRAETVQVLLFAGRLDQVVRRADELLERALGRRGRQLAATMRALAIGCQGRPDEATLALDALEGSVTDDWDGRGELLAARTEIEFLAGRSRAALGAYDAFVQIPCPSASSAIATDVVAAWARFELERDPGPSIGPLPWPLVAGAHQETAGLVALHVGDASAAAEHFAEAERRWAGFYCLRELMCRWARGEALRRAGSADAETILTTALESADAIGFRPVANRARRSLRQAGVHIAAPRDESVGDRTARLTSREREVLGLVGHGLATPEIARRIALGRGTVNQILGAAMRKLGASSRVQAAALLERGPDHAAAAPIDPPGPTLLVRDEDDARAAVLAALDGARVAIDPTADPALADRVHADLRRLGRPDRNDVEDGSAAELGADGQRLLGLIAEGMSLGEAANALHIPRRTADRRLEAARRVLGVATTAEALVAFQRRGRRQA